MSLMSVCGWGRKVADKAADSLEEGSRLLKSGSASKIGGNEASGNNNQREPQ